VLEYNDKLGIVLNRSSLVLAFRCLWEGRGCDSRQKCAWWSPQAM